MKAYTGKFIKKDGSERLMQFIKMEDLPDIFIQSRIKTNKPRLLPEGVELVWDIDKNEFRIFNWNTIIDEIKESTIEELFNDGG